MRRLGCKSGAWCRPLTAALFVLAILSATCLQAATMTWTNMAGGYFTNTLNWTTQTVPTTTNDTAVFTNDIRAAPYTVYFTSPPVSNYTYTVTGGKMIFDLGGGTNYFYGPSGSGLDTAQVGSLGVAELTISNGWLATISQPWHSLSTIGTIVRVCNGGWVIGASYCNVAAGTSLIVDGSNAVYDTSAGGYERIYGNLTATNGGIVKFTTLNLYASAGVNSSMEIGSNSLFTSASIVLGQSSAGGTATVHVCGGGVFKNVGGSTLTWTTSISTNVTVTLDAGSLFGVAAATCPILNYGGVLQGSGLVTGSFYNAAATASVRPGGTNTAGTLTFSGAYRNGDTNNGTRSPGTLEIELGGMAANQYDRIVVNGALTATGTLTVSLINGFQPRHGDSFTILQFTSMSGTFDTVNLSPDAEHWDLRKLYVTGEIKYLNPGAIFSVY